MSQQESRLGQLRAGNFRHELVHRGRFKKHLDRGELSHSSNVSDRRRHTPKAAPNRSESLCSGLRAPCGYSALTLAEQAAQIWLEIDDFWPDP